MFESQFVVLKHKSDVAQATQLQLGAFRSVGALRYNEGGMEEGRETRIGLFLDLLDSFHHHSRNVPSFCSFEII